MYSTPSSSSSSSASDDSLPGVRLPAKSDTSRLPLPEGLTAQSVFIAKTGPVGSWYHPDRAVTLADVDSSTPRQVASLTKLATMLVVERAVSRRLCCWYDLVTISELADSVHGTTSGVQVGEVYTLEDLYYAVMLPSGNDAATAVAEFVGKRLPPLTAEQASRHVAWGDGPHYDGSWSSDVSHPLTVFVTAMNTVASDLGMHDTVFANPHGLMNSHHQSTARDMFRLTVTMLNRYDKFNAVVPTVKHVAKTQAPSVRQRTRTWTNTNRLLSIGARAGGPKCVGIKTGITPAAGGCLSSAFLTQDNQTVVCIVLGCRNKTMRFVDTSRVVQHCLAK